MILFDVAHGYAPLFSTQALERKPIVHNRLALQSLRTIRMKNYGVGSAYDPPKISELPKVAGQTCCTSGATAGSSSP